MNDTVENPQYIRTIWGVGYKIESKTISAIFHLVDIAGLYRDVFHYPSISTLCYEAIVRR